MSPNAQMVRTGVPSLDTLLGGGLPARQSLIVTGDPGSGKTVLCSQIAFAQASAGTRAVIATITSESHDKLIQELSGFSFFQPDLVGKNMMLLSAYSWLKEGAEHAKSMLLGAVREQRAKLLFVDGLRTLRDLWGNEAELRDFLYNLNVGLAAHDCLGLFTTEYSLPRLLEYPESTTADGILSLSMKMRGPQLARRIMVQKLRGRRHLGGEHVMHITGDGIRVIPRLEATVEPNERDVPTDERASFGLPVLDKLLHGGIPKRSTTLILGTTGVGKTLLSLHFAAAGAESGEPALFVSYTEPPQALIARAEGIGLRVRSLVAAGKVRLLYRPSTEVEADDVAAELLSEIRNMGARRLVVDGIGELEHSVFDAQRKLSFLSAFILALRLENVTSIFVKEVNRLAGLDVSDTPIAITAENMMFLRHFEWDGKLHRVLSVLKVRASEFDEHLREFLIRRDGLQVLESIPPVGGLLTGSGQRLNVHDVEAA